MSIEYPSFNLLRNNLKELCEICTTDGNAKQKLMESLMLADVVARNVFHVKQIIMDASSVNIKYCEAKERIKELEKAQMKTSSSQVEKLTATNLALQAQMKILTSENFSLQSKLVDKEVELKARDNLISQLQAAVERSLEATNGADAQEKRLKALQKKVNMLKSKQRDYVAGLKQTSNDPLLEEEIARLTARLQFCEAEHSVFRKPPPPPPHTGKSSPINTPDGSPISIDSSVPNLPPLTTSTKSVSPPKLSPKQTRSLSNTPIPAHTLMPVTAACTPIPVGTPMPASTPIPAKKPNTAAERAKPAIPVSPLTPKTKFVQPVPQEQAGEKRPLPSPKISAKRTKVEEPSEEARALHLNANTIFSLVKAFTSLDLPPYLPELPPSLPSPPDNLPKRPMIERIAAAQALRAERKRSITQARPPSTVISSLNTPQIEATPIESASLQTLPSLQIPSHAQDGPHTTVVSSVIDTPIESVESRPPQETPEVPPPTELPPSIESAFDESPLLEEPMESDSLAPTPVEPLAVISTAAAIAELPRVVHITEPVQPEATPSATGTPSMSSNVSEQNYQPGDSTQRAQECKPRWSFQSKSRLEEVPSKPSENDSGVQAPRRDQSQSPTSFLSDCLAQFSKLRTAESLELIKSAILNIENVPNPVLSFIELFSEQAPSEIDLVLKVMTAINLARGRQFLPLFLRQLGAKLVENPSLPLPLHGLFIRLARLQGQVQLLRVVLFDMFFLPSMPSGRTPIRFLCSLADVWPESLDASSSLLARCVQFLLSYDVQQFRASKLSPQEGSDFQLLESRLPSIFEAFNWPTEPEPVHRLVDELMVSLESEPYTTGTKEFTPYFSESLRSFELLSRRYGWHWTWNELIRTKIWPLLHKESNQGQSAAFLVLGYLGRLEGSGKIPSDQRSALRTALRKPLEESTSDLFNLNSQASAALSLFQVAPEGGDLRLLWTWHSRLLRDEQTSLPTLLKANLASLTP